MKELKLHNVHNGKLNSPNMCAVETHIMNTNVPKYAYDEHMF